MNDYIDFKLKNNIKCIISNVDNINIINIELIIKCGFNNEYNGINNYTHLVEHLIASFYNKNNFTDISIKNKLSGKVFKTNAYTNEYTVGFWINCYYKDINFFIKLFSDSLYYLYITPESLDMAKRNVIKELQKDEDVQYYNDINKYLYNMNKVSNKYGIIDVNNATIDSVMNFYKKLLNKDIIISILANKNHNVQIKKIITKFFDKKIIKSIDTIPHTIGLIKPIKNIIIKHFKPIQSIDINIVIPVDIELYSIKYISLKIILNYLFSFEFGPMYKELRIEHKIIYGINYNIGIDVVDKKKSIITINSTCQPKDLDLFIKLFNNILDKFIMDIDSFILFKQKYIFDKKYAIMNNNNLFQKYYTTLIFYNKKVFKYNMYLKNIKNIKYNEIIKYIKILKNHKKIIFLYNNKYEKQID